MTRFVVEGPGRIGLAKRDAVFDAEPVGVRSRPGEQEPGQEGRPGLRSGVRQGSLAPAAQSRQIDWDP